MTTSTLELVDWATILDDEPACEMDGCGAAATCAVVGACGCAVIACQSCADANVEWIAGALRYFHAVECGDCGRVLFGDRVSDIATVVPL